MSGFHLYAAVCLYFALLNAGGNVMLSFLYAGATMAYMALGFLDGGDKQG